MQHQKRKKNPLQIRNRQSFFIVKYFIRKMIIELIFF